MGEMGGLKMWYSEYMWNHPEAWLYSSIGGLIILAVIIEIYIVIKK